MAIPNGTAQILRRRIQSLETELEGLRKQLLETEAVEVQNSTFDSSGDWNWPLDPEEYQRYGRQMIVPEVGLQGWPPLEQVPRLYGILMAIRRSAQPQECVRVGSRCRRIGMSCVSLSGRRRGRYLGTRRRRHGRGFESAPSDPTYVGQSRHAEGGQRN